MHRSSVERLESTSHDKPKWRTFFTYLCIFVACSCNLSLWKQLQDKNREGLDAKIPATPKPKRTLVVYSGPSSSEEKKLGLYEANLQYFLANGGVVDDCGHNQSMLHDTVFVVGQEFYYHYSALIKSWKAARFNTCYQQSESEVLNKKPTERSNVWVVGRRPVCFDMETARLAFYGGLGVNIFDYDYFLFVNCGLSGPGPMRNTTTSLPWTAVFTSKLSDTVKMSGLTLNTKGVSGIRYPHIQSFLYALDHVGMEIMLKTGTIFDCTNKDGQLLEDVHDDVVVRYEVGMGRAILDSGYALSPLHDNGNPACAHLSNENKAQCRIMDPWYESRLPNLFGHMPSLEEALFFKSSRFLTPEVSKLINYTDQLALSQ